MSMKSNSFVILFSQCTDEPSDLKYQFIMEKTRRSSTFTFRNKRFICGFIRYGDKYISSDVDGRAFLGDGPSDNPRSWVIITFSTESETVPLSDQVACVQSLCRQRLVIDDNNFVSQDDPSKHKPASFSSPPQRQHILVLVKQNRYACGMWLFHVMFHTCISTCCRVSTCIQLIINIQYKQLLFYIYKGHYIDMSNIYF